MTHISEVNWGETSAYDIDCTFQCAKICLDPKLKFFDDCFVKSNGERIPGFGMSDIDGVVERNGQVLFMEWKRPGVHLTPGQLRLHQELTKNSRRQKTIVVWGDPQHMTCERFAIIQNGQWLNQGENCDIDGLKERIHQWFIRADLFNALP